VIFFEIVTARLPFEASDPPTFLIKHMKERPPTPRSLNPRVPEKLDALIVQLLEKDPRARPVDAHRVEKDLIALGRELGARIPPDPEEDPESSRPPARTLPAIVVEEWLNRVQVFERMFSIAYGGSPPKEQERTLVELRGLVRELTQVRAANAKAQRGLEGIDARGREGRQRFGFAVDALGLDSSKAKDEARAARTESERLGQEMERARQAYADAQRELLLWEGRSGGIDPHTQLAYAYRRCAEVVDAWRTAHDRERESRIVLEDKERTVGDLDYQIAQLRGALASHEQEIDRHREAAHKSVVEVSERAEHVEHQLLELATRFCSPLRGRPELGPLFQQLESEAAATA
jgi:serine/threonine-protein kinase